MFKGAANIEEGAVINLVNMPRPGLADDRESITISPGQTWDEVYEVMDAEHLTTLGARVAGVGVGGAVTGCKSCMLKCTLRQKTLMPFSICYRCYFLHIDALWLYLRCGRKFRGR